jgi:hypothetical protein
MDRFEIIKGVDPFADMPRGDGCTYEVTGEKCKGWRIDQDSLIIDISENALNFLMTLKEKRIKITCKGKKENFEIIRLFAQNPYIDKRTKTKRVRAHFEGQLNLNFHSW